MSPLPEKIVKFIHKHHVLTLATCVDDTPWCSNIFYAFDSLRGIFIFNSDPATRHGREATVNPSVAGSIVLETKIVGKVQGLQITGIMKPATEESHKKTYLGRFPYAAAAKLDLWTLEAATLKFTDNTLGFGKKLNWERNGIEDR